MLGHAGDEDCAPCLDRRLLARERYNPCPGENVKDFLRGMAVQADPVAGAELGDAASDPVGRRAALGEERAPADAPPDRIVPAVLRRIRLVEDHRPSTSRLIVHLRSLPARAASPLAAGIA